MEFACEYRDKKRAEAAKNLGMRGEEAACALLRQKGLAILERNWRQGRLELDIVCRDKDCLVFVEVKTRDADGLTSPDQAMTPRKRNSLLRAVQAWIAANDAWERPCRIDVVAVYAAAQNLSLEHYVDALQYAPPVGGGNTSWQPW